MSGNCSVYGDLRSQFGDLGEDQNLVEFFRAVLDRRDRLEDEDRTWQPQTATVVAEQTNSAQLQKTQQKQTNSA